MRNYGYKVCYKKQGSYKWRVYVVTNTYNLALWHARWYEREPPKHRNTGKAIENAVWDVLPIKTLAEYKRRWRGCPFAP